MTAKKSQTKLRVNTKPLQCPDCDTLITPTGTNTKTGKHSYQTGVYPCVECLTTLIVTDLNGGFQVATKQRTLHFHPKPSTPLVNGVTLQYDPGHEPTEVPARDRGMIYCVCCDLPIQSTVNTIRARVLKTLIPKETELGITDPDTGESVKQVSKIPLYSTGRLCKSCQSRMNATPGNRPPKHGEFEYLHERIGLRKRQPVTRGMAKSLDLQLEREASTPRYHDMGDVLIPTVPVVEEIDVTAYRAFHRMGKSKKVDFNERNR